MTSCPAAPTSRRAASAVLKALKLWEVSVLPFGMNELARVETVKTAGNIATIREFEDFLRDAGGFSVRQARAIAQGGFKALQEARDEPDAGAAIARALDGLFKLDKKPTTNKGRT
jgi:hypothetical protein